MVAVESPLNLLGEQLVFQDTVKFEIDLLSSENTQVVTKVLSLLFASNEDCLIGLLNTRLLNFATTKAVYDLSGFKFPKLDLTSQIKGLNN